MIKNFFICSYIEETFSDYVLPYLLCDIAAIMGAISAYQRYCL